MLPDRERKAAVARGCELEELRALGFGVYLKHSVNRA